MLFKIKVERRGEISRRFSAAITGFFLVLGLLFASAVFALLGVNPVETFSRVVSVFTNQSTLMQAILRGLPIGFAALGLCLAFKMNFWNIGAEGQMYMGMVASTGVVLMHVYYGIFPDFLVFPIMVMAAFAAGGLYCTLPAVLKARLGVNEILPTLMLNYIAFHFVNFLITGPWRDPRGFGFPLSIAFPPYARLEFFLGHANYVGLPAAFLTAALLFGLLQKTPTGFEMRVLGQNYEAARYAGVKIGSTLLTGSMIAGGLAGIGGLVIVSALIGRLRPGAAAGYGYTAIIIAFLAGLNPWLAVPAAIFFGGLLVAGDVIQATLNLPFAAVQIFQSTIFLMIILGEFFRRYRVKFVK
ncbi:MAG: ABC transporter permease [Candidatus Caldarchaeum sp.]|uniref:ABC transporter permease n=1 Tax=Caldiarchaeum subterraneum TaxID=311458 RepID=A0A7C5Y7Z9_CALS0